MNIIDKFRYWLREDRTKAYSNFEQCAKSMPFQELLFVLSEEPADFAPVDKAYLAAITEILYTKHSLSCPEWVYNKDCFLDKEHFSQATMFMSIEMPELDIKK